MNDTVAAVRSARAAGASSGPAAAPAAPEAEGVDFLQALLGLPPAASAQDGGMSAGAAEDAALPEGGLEAAGASDASNLPATLGEALRLAQTALAIVPAALHFPSSAGDDPGEVAVHVASRLGPAEDESARKARPGDDRHAHMPSPLRAGEPAWGAPTAAIVRTSDEIERHGDAAPADIPPPSAAASEALQHLREALRAEPARAAIASPVTSPAFAEAAAERVTWLVARGIERAEIAVTPPDLGPVEVRISIERGEATIQFVAASPETRSALEESLPRLAERLAEGGIALANATVSSERRSPREPAPALDPAAVAKAGDEQVGAIEAARGARVAIGLVDDFA